MGVTGRDTSIIRRSVNEGGVIHDPSLFPTYMGQKITIHHEVHEEHEGRHEEILRVFLRVLRDLRGEFLPLA